MAGGVITTISPSGYTAPAYTVGNLSPNNGYPSNPPGPWPTFANTGTASSAFCVLVRLLPVFFATTTEKATLTSLDRESRTRRVGTASWRSTGSRICFRCARVTYRRRLRIRRRCCSMRRRARMAMGGIRTTARHARVSLCWLFLRPNRTGRGWCEHMVLSEMGGECTSSMGMDFHCRRECRLERRI